MFKTDNLYQNDQRWKDALLGFSPSVTIGSWGCLLTSTAMVVNGLGFQETPQTMNAKMRSVGGFNGAAFFPSYVPAAFPGVVYVDYVDCEKSPAPLARIDSALEAGKPVIVCVDWNPQAGVQTHWVVLKAKKNNNYTMYDPYQYRGDSPSKELILTDRYKHQGADPAKAILAAIFFDGQHSAPVEPPKPVEIPAEALTVYAIEDGLSLRAEANVAAFRYKALALNTALTCLEDKATALARLGVNGQWLHVQDPEGQQGYCAAWYLAAARKESKPAAGAPDSTKFETTPARTAVPADAMTVYVIEDGLSFRDAPNLTAVRLKALALNTSLVSLEAAAVAKSKLGVNGQWLHVQDAAGQQGYVAAWYVAAQKAAPAEAPKETPPVSAPAESSSPSAAILAVTPTEQSVMFRSKPQVSTDTQIRQLSSQEILTVLETPAATAFKLGKQGEWLKVRDAHNQEGYVAAWYVKAAAPAGPTQPAAPLSLAVKTSGEEVALRSQPVVADNTLIKRLPKGSPLTILDPKDADKVGQQDQWIKVKDAQGAEGYIAAWYLSR
jgi:SH3-like domain-containing protein